MNEIVSNRSMRRKINSIFSIAFNSMPVQPVRAFCYISFWAELPIAKRFTKRFYPLCWPSDFFPLLFWFQLVFDSFHVRRGCVIDREIQTRTHETTDKETRGTSTGAEETLGFCHSPIKLHFFSTCDFSALANQLHRMHSFAQNNRKPPGHGFRSSARNNNWLWNEYFTRHKSIKWHEALWHWLESRSREWLVRIRRSPEVKSVSSRGARRITCRRDRRRLLRAKRFRNRPDSQSLLSKWIQWCRVSSPHWKQTAVKNLAANWSLTPKRMWESTKNALISYANLLQSYFWFPSSPLITSSSSRNQHPFKSVAVGIGRYGAQTIKTSCDLSFSLRIVIRQTNIIQESRNTRR